MSIIYNGYPIGETDHLDYRYGDTLELDGTIYKVIAVDYYEEPVVLVKEHTQE